MSVVLTALSFGSVQQPTSTKQMLQPKSHGIFGSLPVGRVDSNQVKFGFLAAIKSHQSSLGSGEWTETTSFRLLGAQLNVIAVFLPA